MISAWLVCITFSVILARFYKGAFDGKKLFGKDLWFMVRRSAIMRAFWFERARHDMKYFQSTRVL